MTLKNNIPKFIAREKYTSEVLDAIQPEIDKIKAKLSDILLECCVSTCTEVGIKRFERDYKIEFDANLTLKERKRQVINKMLARKRLSKSGLSEFIKRNVNYGQYYISNEAEEYSFKVILVNRDYVESLYNALFEARPAHLVFKITITDYSPKCGSFYCGEVII